MVMAALGTPFSLAPGPQCRLPWRAGGGLAQGAAGWQQAGSSGKQQRCQDRRQVSPLGLLAPLGKRDAGAQNETLA